VSAQPGTVRHQPLDLRTAEGMLSFVDGCEDRETWVAIGMALKSEFGDPAFDAWERWSANAANYSAPACRSSWRGFKAHNGGYTIGTLVKLAKDGGYRFDASDAPQVDQAELARRRTEQANRKAAEQAQREQASLNAEQVAKQQWHDAMRTGTSAYATRKGIDAPESCRFVPESQGGGLVIPMLRYDLDRAQALKGVQTIKDDGSKKFTYGMSKPGTACRLGLPVVGEPVFVCEGYATGMSIRMALERRYPVFVAFDAYNLPVVVAAVHQALPGSPIVICADDDYKTTNKGLPNNVGRIQAQVAMESVMDAGARLVMRTFPLFKKDTARGDKDTDFNDLHRLEGLSEVAAQLQFSLDTLQELKTYG
jgi:putative DNA primase/helicase